MSDRDAMTHSMASTVAPQADAGATDDAAAWSGTDRARRLGTALTRMAHDLAAIKGENRDLRRENASLHRRIERLKGEER